MKREIHPTEMGQGENDIQHLTSIIAGKIGEGAQKIESSFSSACICRVPKYLRKLKESAYTPRLIAIGPLHRNDEHLQTPLQHIKMSYTNDLLSRLTAGIEDQDQLAEQTKFTVLRKCLAEMKTLIDNAKKYYAEEVTLDEEMLLVDGCFILEFLYRSHHRTSKGPKADPIFGNGPTLANVENDLVLLENQIPFFVLEKLYQLTVGRVQDRLHKNWSLTDYVQRCYGKKTSREGNSNNSRSAKTWCSPSDCVLRVFGNKLVNSTTKEEEKNEGKDHNANYYHILHNIHEGYLPHGQIEQKASVTSDDEVVMPSASELHYAGVKFVPDARNDRFMFISEPKGLFWRCGRARFVIPPLQLYDDTELHLRNLIAFEQCCPGISQNVLSFALVMDMLVNNDKDIQVLENAGVLRNCLGATEDATDLFNKLCKETVYRDGELLFIDTRIKATQYSKRFWPKNMALLGRTYFVSPWKFIAFCVGFIAFVISFVEFVLSFFRKEKGGCGCQGTTRWG